MRAVWDVPFRYIVLVLTLIALLAVAWTIREIFQPLVLAGLAAYLLSPLVNLLTTRTRLKRRAAANIVFFSALALLTIAIVTVVPVVFSQVQGLMADISRVMDDLQVLMSEPYHIGSISVYLGTLLPALRAPFGGVIVPDPEQALALVETTSRGFLWSLVVIVTTYYLITDWQGLREWLINIAPANEQPDLRRLYSEVRGIWLGYLGGQLRLIAVLMVIYTTAWAAVGLPGVLVLGPLAGLLNLLPEIGPFIAAVLATGIALLEGSDFLPLSNLWFAILILGLYFILNNVKTIFLQPRILGQSVLLHEGVVFVAIITAVVLWGVLGVLIVVPLLASLMVVGRYLRAKLLGLPLFSLEEDEFTDQEVKDIAA